MQHGTDTRLMCGMDLRRMATSPEDVARVEAFLGEYGGTMSVYPVWGVAMAVEWEPCNGPSVTGTGPTVAMALQSLRERVTQC